MSKSFGARAVRGLTFAVLMATASVVPALAAEPAVLPNASAQEAVATLDRTLLDVMQNARQLGFKGRYAKLESMVRQVFDVRLMTSIAVGGGWSDLTPAQQDQLTDAFGKFIAATYAQRFDGYSGEKFVEAGAHPVASGTMVETQLVKSDGDPIVLNYLTRQNAGQWHVVDVFLTGTISELATRRSEFSSVFRRAGYDGLLQTLQQKVAQLESPTKVS